MIVNRGSALKNQRTLIIGANSGIAKAIVAEINKTAENGIIVISRNLKEYEHMSLPAIDKIEVFDYSENSIITAVNAIKQINNAPITRVFICHGILHTKNIQPEKRLEDFNAEAFLHVMTANALSPLLWLKALTPKLTGKNPCKITVFSARVGSISDNQLGGWYSYRASKASLNMLLKTAVVELARRAKNIKIISFHPGTTDTELSKPFQKNVPDGRLFTCEFVAKQLLTIVENTPVDGKLSYVDWQGKNIDW